MITYPAAAALAAVASLLIGKQSKGLPEKAVRAATWAGFAMGGKFVLNTLARPIGAVATLGDFESEFDTTFAGLPVCAQDPVTGAFGLYPNESDPWTP